MKSKKSQSSEKTPVLDKQNAQSTNAKKTFNRYVAHYGIELGANCHIPNALFYVVLKEKEDGFKRGVAYPVFMIENTIAEMPQVKKSPIQKLVSDKYGHLPPEKLREKIDDLSNTLDDDDMEAIEENYVPEESIEMTVVWFFIANYENGRFAWIDSSKTYYLQ